MPRAFVWIAIVALAGAQPMSTADAADDPPKGALNARPARELLEAWTNKSLWVTDLAGLTAPECFDFHHFEDCAIWSVDTAGRLSRKGGRLCEVREFTVDREPGHVPGNYGLIIGGIGSTYTVSFAQVVQKDARAFQQAGSPGGWSFELVEGPCSTRAAK